MSHCVRPQPPQIFLHGSKVTSPLGTAQTKTSPELLALVSQFLAHKWHRTGRYIQDNLFRPFPFFCSQIFTAFVRTQSPSNGHLLCWCIWYIMEQTDQRSLLPNSFALALASCPPHTLHPDPYLHQFTRTRNTWIVQTRHYKRFRNKFCVVQKGTVHARWYTGLLPRYSKELHLKQLHPRRDTREAQLTVHCLEASANAIAMLPLLCVLELLQR